MTEHPPPNIQGSGIQEGDLRAIYDAFLLLQGQISGIKSELDQLKWGYGPKCSLSNESGQTISSGVKTNIDWDTAQWDTHGFWDSTSNVDRIYIPITGRYRVAAGLLWANNNSGDHRIITVEKNGVAGDLMRDTNTPVTGRSTPVQCVRDLALVEGDYITVTGQQDSGGDLAINSGGDQRNFVELFRVGDIEG